MFEYSTRRTLRTALLASAAMATVAGLTPARAQDAATEEAKPAEKVVVTGSRIPKKDYTSTSPIATISAQQIKDSGATTIEQLLNTLPQVIPTAGRGSDNQSSFGGAGGSSTVDLRGLGPNRVLVLLNGRRLAPFDVAGNADLNSIPATLIDRVEVVTGGASSVYGSDAVSGVVNFVLKRDFQGMILDSSYGVSGQGDGNEWQVNGALGASLDDDRGNVFIYGGYYNRDGIYTGERDFSKFTYTQLAPNLRGKAAPAGGRFANIPGNDFAPVNDGLSSSTTDPVGGNCTSLSTSKNIIFDGAGNTIRGYCNVLDVFGGDRFNDNPYNLLIIPAEAWHVATSGQFEVVEDRLIAYMDIFYNKNQSFQSIGPSPTPPGCCIIEDPRGTVSGTGNMNTWLLQTSIQNALSGRADPDGIAQFETRFPEFGPRTRHNNTDAVQFVAGFKGDLGEGWEYDTYINYANNSSQLTERGDIYRDRFTDALRNKVDESACGGPEDASINLYGTSRTLTAADMCYLGIPAMNDTSEINQFVYSISMTGEPIALPAGNVGVAFGFEYRELGVDNVPDSIKQANNQTGFNAAAESHGSFDVFESFIEANVPLISDVPLIKYFGIEAAYRGSEYSSVGHTDTYKFAAEWQPIEDVRFRGTYARADRAPNLQELFQGGDQTFPGYVDPCLDNPPASIDPGVAAFCAASYNTLGASGVYTPGTFVQNNPQFQVNLFGNAFDPSGRTLTDEKADTYTIGIVLTPSAWKNFSLAIDYYAVTINDLIGVEYGTAQGKINQCFQVDQNLAALSCQGITRGPNGDLATALYYVNAGTNESEGVDLEFNLRLTPDDFGLDPSYGTFGVHFLGSWNRLNELNNGGNNVGVLFEGFSLPEFAASTRFNYDVDDLHFAWTMQYIDQVFDPTSFAVQDPVLYHALSAQWSATDHMMIYGGVNNLFDQEPRLFERPALGGNTNTDPQRYDVVGRQFFAGVTFRY